MYRMLFLTGILIITLALGGCGVDKVQDVQTSPVADDFPGADKPVMQDNQSNENTADANSSAAANATGDKPGIAPKDSVVVQEEKEDYRDLHNASDDFSALEEVVEHLN